MTADCLIEVIVLASLTVYSKIYGEKNIGETMLSEQSMVSQKW